MGLWGGRPVCALVGYAHGEKPPSFSVDNIKAFTEAIFRISQGYPSPVETLCIEAENSGNKRFEREKLDVV
jgi:hypothetical protein